MSEIGTELNDAVDDDFGELEAVLSTIAAEGDKAVVARIYRLKGGERVFLFKALPSDMENLHEMLRDDYGGGKFEAFIYRGNHIAKRKTFSIEPPKKSESAPRESNEMQVILQGMNQLGSAITELGRMMVEIRQAPPLPQTSPLSSMKELAELMATMQGMMPKPAQVDPMAQFKQTMELAQIFAENMNGGPAEVTPGQALMKLTEQLTPVLVNLTAPKTTAPAMQRSNAIPGAVMPKPTPAHPRPVVTTPSATPVQPTKSDPNMLIKMAMKPQIEKILAFANQGVTPEEMAPHVIDAVPEAYFEKFGDFMFSETCVDEMIAMVPAAATKREWFNELRAKICAELTPQDPETIIDSSLDSGLVEDDNDNGAIEGHSIG